MVVRYVMMGNTSGGRVVLSIESGNHAAFEEVKPGSSSVSSIDERRGRTRAVVVWKRGKWSENR